MKSIFPLILLLPSLACAQELVSHDPANRTVLLEEYAAVNCGNCPAAYVVAGNILGAHPSDVVVVEIHGGGLAIPSGGQPDFRTTAGAALWSQFGVTFQPQGMVNRQGLQSASQWAPAVNNALTTLSPVNIGMATNFEQGSRLLTVDVELYYTADGVGDDDRIYVLLTEDHIVGYQQDYVNGPQVNFDHRHVLRSYVTPLAGDEVVGNTAGTSVVRTYTFTVPEAWNIEQCQAIAFVGEQSVGSAPGVVYQVKSVAASGGSTTGIAQRPEATLGNAFPVPASDFVTIPSNGAMSGELLRVVDGAGRVVIQQRIAPFQGNVTLYVSELANGVYHYGINGQRMKPLVVLH